MPTTGTRCRPRASEGCRIAVAVDMRAKNGSPLDAGGYTELVVLRICHRDPMRPPEAPDAIVESLCAERLQPLDLDLDILGDDVHMHAVLPGLRLGYLLEDERGSIHVMGDKDRQGLVWIV